LQHQILSNCFWKTKWMGLLNFTIVSFQHFNYRGGLNGTHGTVVEGPRDTSKGITSTHHTFGKWHNHAQKLWMEWCLVWRACINKYEGLWMMNLVGNLMGGSH
jgi:hypothetical protein